MTTRRTRRLVPPTPLLTLALAAATAFAATTTPSPATAQDVPTIEEMAQGTTAMEGFFNLYWDDDAGALYWEIAELDTEFLYQISMGSGAIRWGSTEGSCAGRTSLRRGASGRR